MVARTVLGVLGAAAVVVAAPGCARKPQRHTVTVKNFLFAPAALTVAPGDTVEWTNGDVVPHTATASDSTWDSKTIDAGASWRYVARATGRHPYICVFHPNMRGTIDVR